MTNKDVLSRGILHESEELMYFLLFDFWEQLKQHGNLDSYRGQCPLNLVTVYKNFLKQETMVDTEIHDKYHPINTANVIDADFKEI